MFIPALLIGGLLLMAGGASKKRRRTTTQPGPVQEPGREPTPEEAEAIIYCEMEGGEGVAMETPDGETYYVCMFQDGRMVEAGAFHRGEASPQCPIEMMWDEEAQACVAPQCPPGGRWDPEAGACVAIGDAWPPEPDDPNFQICMGALLAAWAPYSDEDYNLAPAVAQNVYLIMLNAVEESWAGYETPEALADFGMVHVAPECDWYALREYVQQYKQEVGMYPGNPDDVARGDEVYQSVLALAHEALADADVEPDVGFDQGEGKHGLNQGVNPDQGGVFPKCPPNYFYDALHDVCCPDGWYWHEGDQMCRPPGYSGMGMMGRHRGIAGKRKKPQGNTKAHRVDMIRNGFAGGCGGRRGHCGVRPR